MEREKKEERFFTETESSMKSYFICYFLLLVIFPLKSVFWGQATICGMFWQVVSRQMPSGDQPAYLSLD